MPEATHNLLPDKRFTHGSPSCLQTIEWGGQQCCDVMDDEDGEDDYEDEDYKDDDDEFETNDGFVGGTQPFGGEQFE